MNGKGSKNRTSDYKAYRDRWPLGKRKGIVVGNTYFPIISDKDQSIIKNYDLNKKDCDCSPKSLFDMLRNLKQQRERHPIDPQGYCTNCGGGPGINCVCDICQSARRSFPPYK
jgi:hypothetical protein